MRKFLPIIACLMLTGCLDYSDGDKAGSVTKISRKGYFCKTWEGQINLGGMRKETQIVGSGKDISTVENTVVNTWDFTVEESHKDLIPIIQKYLESGQRITLHYHQEVLTFCRSDSDNYFVDSVTEGK